MPFRASNATVLPGAPKPIALSSSGEGRRGWGACQLTQHEGHTRALVAPSPKRCPTPPPKKVRNVLWKFTALQLSWHSMTAHAETQTLEARHTFYLWLVPLWNNQPAEPVIFHVNSMESSFFWSHPSYQRMADARVRGTHPHTSKRALPTTSYFVIHLKFAITPETEKAHSHSFPFLPLF